MSIVSLFFYLFEATAALSAISLIFVRNVFYGALLLMICLLSIAGLYVLSFAEFIAITQILIYAGGVLVVIIFGIMLTAKTNGKPLQVTHAHRFSGFLAGLSLFILLIYFLSGESFPELRGNGRFEGETMINQIGIELMTSYVIPFEVAGILLLIALVGAAVMAASRSAQ